MPVSVVLVFAVAVSAVAAVGWGKTPLRVERPVRSIRIVDVRPLRTSDPSLRDVISHTFAVRVAISGWKLLPYQPGATASDNHPGAGHWGLYLDGGSLGENFGTSRVTYTPYLRAGTHWIAAELRNADGSSLKPPLWSEPVILHVPRVIRCWQTGWRGSPENGTPTFVCKHRRASRESRFERVIQAKLLRDASPMREPPRKQGARMTGREVER
jgi:hypothetical protein